MGKALKGSCICKSVEYEVADNFMTFKLCHCNLCKKASGGAHVANAFAKPEDINWVKGAANMHSFDVPNSMVRRVFCKTCGTTLPFVTQNEKFLVVPVGSLATQPTLPPQAVVSWDNRMPWYDAALELTPEI